MKARPRDYDPLTLFSGWRHRPQGSRADIAAAIFV
jgi:hypothetical protein